MENSKFGKLVKQNMPIFYQWCYDTKIGNKKKMVEILYPMEYNYIKKILITAYQQNISVITCHDAVFTNKKEEDKLLYIMKVIMDEDGILSEMKKQWYKAETKLLHFEKRKDCITI